MKQQLINQWEHSPLENQVTKVPVKEVPNSFEQKSVYSANDLLGLSWTLFEEDYT